MIFMLLWRGYYLPFTIRNKDYPGADEQQNIRLFEAGIEIISGDEL